MRQALLEALFTRCVFDLYTLRGSTLLSPLSQIKAQRGPPNLAKVTQVVHGKARAQTQRVWLEISAPVSTGVPLGGPPRARGHYLCRLLMLRHHLGVCAESPRSSGESSQQAGVQLRQSRVLGVTWDHSTWSSHPAGTQPKPPGEATAASRRHPSSQPSGSPPCDPAPPRSLPSSPSCPSDPFSTLLPMQSSRIQV